MKLLKLWLPPIPSFLFWNSLFPDKDQEVDLETRIKPDVVSEEVDTDGGAGGGGGDGGRGVMSTINKSLGNKSLTHMNSLSALTSKVPKYGVHTEHEEELSQYIDSINTWGIDVFKIAEFSNSRPLTTVTFRVFQVSCQL